MERWDEIVIYGGVAIWCILSALYRVVIDDMNPFLPASKEASDLAPTPSGTNVWNN